jgi:hypothetical protein
MTTQAEKLRAQRAALIQDRTEQRDRFISARQDAEQKIVEARAALDKKVAAFEEHARGFDVEIAQLDAAIAAAVAAERLQQLHEVAAEIDRDGESPERWQRFERLAAQLHPHYVKPNHEMRTMNCRRMRRDPEVCHFGPPYRTVADMALAWTTGGRAPQEPSKPEIRKPHVPLGDDVPEKLRARDVHGDAPLTGAQAR